MSKYKGRNFVANLMASVLIVGWGLVGCLFLVMIMSPNDYSGYGAAFLLFGFIALIPLAGMRRSADAHALPYFLAMLAHLRLKRRRRVATGLRSPLDRKYWRRQKNSFIPEPFGQREASTFTRTRGEDRPES